MTRDSLKKLDEHGITITADDTNTVKDHEEKQSQNDEKHVENSELLEVRKLIQAMVKEEIQKIQ
ncbi:unnamed protein product, partial [Rotaria magnacalcarata]